MASSPTQPSPAEIARTLSAGRLPGTAYVAHGLGPHQVRHATDAQGRVLLLVSVVSDLARALRPGAGAETAVVLDVPDLPPAAGSPALGRVWISGWAAPLTGAEARQAALDFADTDPTGDLLDVGRGFALHRFEPAEVRLETGGAVLRIDPGEYVVAEPDPLHPVEREIIVDLTRRHAPRLTELFSRHLADRASGTPPRLVRIDRYGMVVALGRPGPERTARLVFPRPVRDRADLVRLLQPVLRPGHAPAGAAVHRVGRS
ncbi:DUF2470 domain-containing protein [Micromonospora echinofusca]|uniref:DUF2470 domain-containing protein n=1 Tax=Micromonospora echinofusca TaxID=47858 RepID=A0ABS3VNG6_MICEH|nr:DUF2470 domain-containing protein [Micromonospora echinofusca]MBO4206055.1 DUF2470 domain-containing protein [Micromonospora echinofusca]